MYTWRKLGFRKIFKNIPSFKRGATGSVLYNGSSTKIDEQDGLEENIEQQPNERTVTENGDERETTKACDMRAYKIIGQTPKTCVSLGHDFRKDGKNEDAIYYYEKAFEISQKEDDQIYQAEALRGLGHTYREAGEHEKAIDYYQQALSLARAGSKRMQVAEVFIGLGHAYENNGQYTLAIENYEMAKKTAKEHHCKWEVREACHGMGRVYKNIGDNETAKQYLLEALNIVPKQSFRRKSKIYLDLAHTYRSNSEYQKAIESYKSAVKLAQKNGNVWEEVLAYQGLGDSFVKLGQIEEGEEYFVKAKKTTEKKWEILPEVLHIMNHHTLRDAVDQTPEGTYHQSIPLINGEVNDRDKSDITTAEGLREVEDQLPLPEEANTTIYEGFVKKTPPQEVLVKKMHDVYTYQASIEEGLTEEIAKTMAKNVKTLAYVNLTKLDEDVNTTIDESFVTKTQEVLVKKMPEVYTYQASIEEGLTEEIARKMAENVKTLAYVNLTKLDEEVNTTIDEGFLVKKMPEVYTYQASIEEGLTEEIAKKMAENVKTSAYVNLLNQSDGKGSGDDSPIYFMAKKCVCKNDPTNRPGRLSNLLAKFNSSIGLIACGCAQGTCFLVAGNFVITCYHVYLDLVNESRRTNQPTVLIKVYFNYYKPDELENAVVVETDESYKPTFYSEGFDYILLLLKQSSHLNRRVRLGQLVRGYHVYDGLLCIIGFPEGRELREETCVIVQADYKERLIRRMNGGIHMANIEILFKEYPQRLAYDSSFFRGSSGSPGFGMNGEIIVLHAQRYQLDVGGKKYSLMEFGINFSAICEDLESRFHIANVFFPNWKLEDNVETMETD